MTKFKAGDIVKSKVSGSILEVLGYMWKDFPYLKETGDKRGDLWWILASPNSATKSVLVKAQPLPRPYIREITLFSIPCGIF